MIKSNVIKCLPITTIFRYNFLIYHLKNADKSVKTLFSIRIPIMFSLYSKSEILRNRS